MERVLSRSSSNKANLKWYPQRKATKRGPNCSGQARKAHRIPVSALSTGPHPSLLSRFSKGRSSESLAILAQGPSVKKQVFSNHSVQENSPAERNRDASNETGSRNQTTPISTPLDEARRAQSRRIKRLFRARPQRDRASLVVTSRRLARGAAAAFPRPAGQLQTGVFARVLVASRRLDTRAVLIRSG